jgi:transcriptional regulator with XRE-family HTH domain
MPGGEMTRGRREEPNLPPGPARDLADLFRWLRGSCTLSIGQIAARSGYSASHVSEVLSGRKAPSPDAAATIAQVIGADANAASRARRHAEDWQQLRRYAPKDRDADAAQADRSAADLLRAPIRHQLRNPDIAITILAGDLLDQKTHIAIGFSDTFDTSVTDDQIINSASLQGQLLLREFGGDERQLDERLAAALAGFSPVAVEDRRDKPLGKLSRYELGTVGVLGSPQRLIFALAYGRMGNDLIVCAPVNELWHCYGRLWDAVYRHGQRQTLSIPLMGGGLARVEGLSRNNLLQLILLSFVAYCRQRVICHELRIVIHPDHIDWIDQANLMAFCQSL